MLWWEPRLISVHEGRKHALVRSRRPPHAPDGDYTRLCRRVQIHLRQDLLTRHNIANAAFTRTVVTLHPSRVGRLNGHLVHELFCVSTPPTLTLAVRLKSRSVRNAVEDYLLREYHDDRPMEDQVVLATTTHSWQDDRYDSDGRRLEVTSLCSAAY
jgi:hypothetical protein